MAQGIEDVRAMNGDERWARAIAAAVRADHVTLASEHAALLEVAKAVPGNYGSVGLADSTMLMVKRDEYNRLLDALAALPDTLKSQLSEEVGK